MAEPRDEQGRKLEVKEGVVLDRNGTQLTSEPGHAGRQHQAFREGLGQPRTFVFKTTNPLAPIIIAPLIIILLGVAVTLFSGVAAAAFATWMAYLIFSTVTRLIRRR